LSAERLRLELAHRHVAAAARIRMELCAARSCAHAGTAAADTAPSTTTTMAMNGADDDSRVPGASDAVAVADA
jgi:hypothetical protein